MVSVVLVTHITPKLKSLMNAEYPSGYILLNSKGGSWTVSLLSRVPKEAVMVTEEIVLRYLGIKAIANHDIAFDQIIQDVNK